MTELVFILDRSGSTSGLEGDTIGVFNSMIGRQREKYGWEFRAQATENIDSRRGVHLRRCRSIQAEDAFKLLKHDFGFRPGFGGWVCFAALLFRRNGFFSCTSRLGAKKGSPQNFSFCGDP